MLIQHSLQNGRSVLVLARYFIEKLSSFLLIRVPGFLAVSFKDLAAYPPARFGLEGMEV